MLCNPRRRCAASSIFFVLPRFCFVRRRRRRRRRHGGCLEFFFSIFTPQQQVFRLGLHIRGGHVVPPTHSARRGGTLSGGLNFLGSFAQLASPLCLHFECCTRAPFSCIFRSCWSVVGTTTAVVVLHLSLLVYLKWVNDHFDQKILFDGLFIYLRRTFCMMI